MILFLLFFKILELQCHLEIFLFELSKLDFYLTIFLFYFSILLIDFLKLVCLFFKLNIQFLINFFNFLNFSLNCQAIFLKNIILNHSLFLLIEFQSSLQFIYYLIFFSHLLSQHLKALFLFLTLNLLSSIILLYLLLKYFIFMLQKS